MKRILLVLLSCGLLIANSGCCGGLVHRLLCCPLGPGTQCDPEHCMGGCGMACGGGVGCGLACEPACGPACGPAVCEPCGPTACEPCGPAACAACGPAACGPDCGGCGMCAQACGPDCGCGHCGGLVGAGVGLLGGIYRALHPPGWCGGCGEIYWSEFHSDPPDCSDPCDRYGNFTDGGCTTCGPVACGPAVCEPAGCATAPQTLPAEEYISRLKPPIEPAPKVTRLAQPLKTKKR